MAAYLTNANASGILDPVALDLRSEKVIDLVVALNHLRRSTLIGADNSLVAVAIGAVVALQHKELLTVTHALRIGHRQRRLAHREEVDRIDDVCLAGTIVADKAVEALVERKLLLCEVVFLSLL